MPRESLGWRSGLLLILYASLAGCAPVLVAAGAAGGYAVSRDSVVSYHDLSQAHVFQQSLTVVKQKGKVTLEDEKHGEIRAIVNEASVTITVKPITATTVELRVKARKNLFPAQAVAQEIYSEITKHL